MKKVFIILTLFLFIACTTKQTSDLDGINFILDSQIEQNKNSMQKLLAINPNHVLPHYDKYINIRLKYDELIGLIQHTENNGDATQLKDSLNKYYEDLINIDPKNDTYTENINSYFSFREFDKDRLFNSIQTIEVMFKQISLYALNHLKEDVYENYRIFESINVLVVPEKNTINLGEEYSAKIYIVADTTAMTEALISEYDTNNQFLLNTDIPNQSLGFAKNNDAYIYKETPTKKGKYKKQGVVDYRDPLVGCVRRYPFTISYEVK